MVTKVAGPGACLKVEIYGSWGVPAPLKVTPKNPNVRYDELAGARERMRERERVERAESQRALR